MKVKDLKDYKSNLYTSLSRDLSEFEKNFLLISGGILAFSITFIREIVEIDVSVCLILLYLSWGFIILSIGLMMYTFLKSSNTSDDLWKIVDDFIITGKLYNDESDIEDNQVDIIKIKVNKTFYKNKAILKGIRFFSVSSFICGIIFLAIFVAINLNNENKNNHGEKTSSKSSNIILYLNEFKNYPLQKTLTYDKQCEFFNPDESTKKTHSKTASKTHSKSTSKTNT